MNHCYLFESSFLTKYSSLNLDSLQINCTRLKKTFLKLRSSLKRSRRWKLTNSSLRLVRSQFEHCSQIWHPNNVTLNEKFESIQRKCLKWVLFEEELSYSCKDVYLRKCMQVKILPLAKRFIFNDFIIFHKIFNNLMPVQMPDTYHCSVE